MSEAIGGSGWNPENAPTEGKAGVEEFKKTTGKVELPQRLSRCTFPVSSQAAAVSVSGTLLLHPRA